MKVGSFWANDWVQAISNHPYIAHVIIWGIVWGTALAVAFLFQKKLQDWNFASMCFEERNKKLLLTLAILVLLASIVFVSYFLLITAPKSYPTR